MKLEQGDYEMLFDELDYLLPRLREIYELMRRTYKGSETPCWKAGRVLRDMGSFRSEMVNRRAQEMNEVPAEFRKAEDAEFEA